MFGFQLDDPVIRRAMAAYVLAILMLTLVVTLFV